MVAKFRIWWQRIKKPLEITGVVLFLVGLLILIVLIILGYIYNWAWVGIGLNAPSFQHRKTLWDWLQLLIIPAVLAVGGYVFNLTVSRNERKATASRDQTERDIATDNQQEAALQAYIDKMSELLLDKNLSYSPENSEVRKIARVRTLTVLPRLDKDRKRSVLQFLSESGLIEAEKPIIVLHEADLSGADLSEGIFCNVSLRGVNLKEAILRNTNLYQSNLSDANLCNTNLKEAILLETILFQANLSEACLTEEQLNEVESFQGAIMPDGSLHP